MTGDGILAHLARRLPDVATAGIPRRLSGGLMNEVWRVPATPRSLIVKHAPPFIATAPDIPLDPRRIVIEGRCLQALGEDGILEQVSSPAVRPPACYDLDAEAHVVVMEDAGDGPDLRGLLARAPGRARQAGEALGRFIGGLHRRSHRRDDLRGPFDNRPIQATRLAVQYRAVGSLLARCGVPDAEALGNEAVALGERLLGPGRCLIMGDLWPPSVLVRGGVLRIVDWEFAHYGNPAQDLAHLAAHLWMIGHRTVSEAAADCWRGVLDAYLAAIAPAGGLWDAGVARDAAVHFAAEILVRAAGAFQAGYLYDGLPPDSVPVREAAAQAAAHLRDGRWPPAFEPPTTPPKRNEDER